MGGGPWANGKGFDHPGLTASPAVLPAWPCGAHWSCCCCSLSSPSPVSPPLPSRMPMPKARTVWKACSKVATACCWGLGEEWKRTEEGRGRRQEKSVAHRESRQIKGGGLRDGDREIQRQMKGKNKEKVGQNRDKDRDKSGGQMGVGLDWFCPEGPGGQEREGGTRGPAWRALAVGQGQLPFYPVD